MTHSKFSYLLSFLFLFALAACSDDDNDVPDPDPDQDPASFTITYTGDIEAEIEGTAFFSETTDPDTGEDVFVIYLHSQEMDGTSISFAKKGLQPGAGSFPIANIDMDADQVDLPENEFLAWGNMHYNEAPMYIYYSDEGTLNLEQSDDNNVIGAFEFSATGLSTDDPMTELDIEISGSFNAVYGEVPDPDPDPGPVDFTATLSGDVDAELTGQAIFSNVTDGDTGEEVFLISLSDNASSSNIWLGKAGTRPEAGTYPIFDIDAEDFDPDAYPEDAFIGIAFLETDASTIYIFSNEGSITLDESTTNTVAGTFDFAATGIDIANPLVEMDIQITGDFDASGGDIDIPGGGF